MLNPVLLSGASFAGLGVLSVMVKSKLAGFDGIEIILFNQVVKRLNEYRFCADSLGLILHLHEAWMLSDNKTHPFNYILNFLGYLPRSLNNLSEVIECRSEPVVVYADRYTSVAPRERIWFQTCSAFGGKNNYKVKFNEFCRTAIKLNLPLVFDTQHYLEFKLGVRGIEYLPKDKSELLDLLIAGWIDLGHLVKEIHLNDFNPRFGHTFGRNVFPGTGIVPLKEFSNFVKNSGWRGSIVPEVSPIHLFPYNVRKLKLLKQRVIELLT